MPNGRAKAKALQELEKACTRVASSHLFDRTLIDRSGQKDRTGALFLLSSRFVVESSESKSMLEGLGVILLDVS